MNMQFAGELPKGIQKITNLPNKDLAELWDSIIMDKALKSQLLSVNAGAKVCHWPEQGYTT